jgi:four helix bundle protein
MPGNAYEKLRVWQEAVSYTKHIYGVTATFPKAEAFGLTSQMRRSAVSIASNIAEGASRNSPKEFAHFISIALGSLAELDTQILIADGLYIDNKTCLELRLTIENLRKMMMGLRTRLIGKQSTVNG